MEANKIIFPHPKRDHDQSNFLKYIKQNIIYIPKYHQTPIGCLSQQLIPPQNNLYSSLNSARTLRQEEPTQTIKIQSSKQLYLNLMKPKHKRSQTKTITVVSARYSNTDQNAQANINTVRTIPPEKFYPPPPGKNLTLNISRDRSKRPSDHAYLQEQSEQFEDGRIQTVRISSRVPNRFLPSAVPTSHLWKYHDKEAEVEAAIPCLYFQSTRHKNKIMVYFHGNGEDIAGCHNFLRQLCKYTEISVLAVEYPGYSLYEGSACSEDIERDGGDVMEFLQQVGFEVHNIMVVGRSIGSGPAIHVASNYPVGGLVLLSPFLSLCQVVQDLYGSLASRLLKQRFDNKARAKEVESPCLIVHGTKDKLISLKHATQLSQYFRGYCSTKIVKQMSHSSFSHEQFFAYVSDFQSTIQFID